MQVGDKVTIFLYILSIRSIVITVSRLCWHQILNNVLYFPLLRCELCALSGEELEKNEERRRRLMDLEMEGLNLHQGGFKVEGLRRFEHKAELMEKHWDELSLQVIGQHHF